MKKLKLLPQILIKKLQLFEGKILKEGIPEELAKDEIVRKVYLGKNFEFKKSISNQTSDINQSIGELNMNSISSKCI